MKKRIYILALAALTCAALAACGTKKEEDTTPKPENTAESTEAPETDSNTDTETETPTEEPAVSEEPSETPEPSATPDAASTETTLPVTGSASGTFVGFVDSHTVEIILADGETVSYQIKKDSVLQALQEMDENGDTDLNFNYKITADEIYIITKVK